MAPWSAAWPLEWWQQERGEALSRGKRRAPSPGLACNDSAEGQRLQADHAARLQESANFQLGDPEKHTGAHDPQLALQKNGGLADHWHMDGGDIMCRPVLVLPFSSGLGRCQCQSRS